MWLLRKEFIWIFSLGHGILWRKSSGSCLRVNSSANPLTFTIEEFFGNLSSKNQPDCQLMPLEVSLPCARDSQLSSIPQVYKSLAQVLHGYRPLCTGGQCFQLMFGIQATGGSWKCPHLTFQLCPSCHCFPPPLEENRLIGHVHELFCRLL